MLTRIVETEYDRTMLDKYLDAQVMPYTVTVIEGKHRSTEQNRLQRLWINEIAQQVEGQTTEEIRGYCKLTIGVPILREQNEAFRQRYDEVVKPLSYEQKLSIMMEPLDMPITRFMTTKQKKEYLDRMYQHWTEKGIILTDPDRFGEAA